MHNDSLPEPLRRFVQSLTSRFESGMSEPVLLPEVGELMRVLVARDDWLPAAYAQSHPKYYRQYLLFADPMDRFSVVSFVWGPGQSTPIHDHTVWGVIGVLRGAERVQGYEIGPGGRPVPLGDEVTLEAGDIGFVSPTVGDVHRVRNAHEDRVSISIHAYGGNIGKIRRHVFPAEGGEAKEFISGYTNAGASQRSVIPSPSGRGVDCRVADLGARTGHLRT